MSSENGQPLRRSKRLAGVEAEILPLPSLRRTMTKKIQVKQEQPDQGRLKRFEKQLEKLTKNLTCLKKHSSNIDKRLKELEKINLEHKCVICYDARISVCLVPCGHTFCLGCIEKTAKVSIELYGIWNRSCPFCRSSSTIVQRLFFN